MADRVHALGTGTTTAATTAAPPASSPPATGTRGESQMAKIARLEAQVRELEAEKTKLFTERGILRAAAKYFAGQMNG